MQYRNDMKAKYSELRHLKEKYGLACEELDSDIQKMNEFRVVSPVIGNFSTGKSTMLNAVLEKNLLSVDITPETAIPTEIYYGANKVLHYYGDKVTEYKIDELPLKGLNVRNTDYVCIQYDCAFLKQIPSVKIVDLPGFDTSIQLHNKVIDQYLPNSLAYLLVVSSDEPVLKDSIHDLLTEFKLFHVPVYLVITKSKRLSEQELSECRKLLQDTVKRILETDEVKCACVESLGDVCIEEVKEFLIEIQQQTERIFKKEFHELLRKRAKYVEIYLLDRMEKKNLSTSELEHEKEKLEKDSIEIEHHISREMDAFEAQLDDCIEEVKKKISEDLEAAIDILTVLIRNGNDASERINGIVRNAVAVSVKAEFEPRLLKYLDKITEAIKIESVMPVEMKLQIDKKLEDGLIHSVLVKVAPFVLASIGAFMAGPLLAIIGAAVGAFGDVALNINNERRKNREAKKTARELVEKVSHEAAKEAEDGMRKYVKQVNDDIIRKVQRQRAILEKSLKDVGNELELEETVKAQDIKNLESDLQIVRSLMNKMD